MANKLSSCHSIIRWAFNISTWSPTKIQWIKGMRLLNSDDRLKIRKFNYRFDAKATFVGKIFIRKFIVDYLKDYSNLKVEKTIRGRPIIPPVAKEWDFNVSHQGDYVVFVAQRSDTIRQLGTESFTKDETRLIKVGVDVMRWNNEKPTKDLDEFFRLMNRQFTPNEWIFIKQHVDDNFPLCNDGGILQKQRNFYRLWCLKESFIKADGKGLGINLQKLNFKPMSSTKQEKIICDTILEIDEKILLNWSFEETFLDANHLICVAINGTYDEKYIDKNKFFRIFDNYDDILRFEEEQESPINDTKNIKDDDEKEWLRFLNQETMKPF